jgi:hypothetical protein
MSASDAVPIPTGPRPAGLSWLELGFFVLLLTGGFLFLRDAPYWGRPAYVGSAQFGDAEFWWNGALHFSQGIVKENPNLTFRMGYAAFGGVVAAVCGPDYRIFHQLLLMMFLLTSCGLYLTLRPLLGRIAAAGAILLFVFNPFTAEWLAISTSDGLGLVLNLLALLALIAGVRDGLQLRWVAVFGVCLACASLTRPLMTPFIAPAALTVIMAAWGNRRRVLLALGVMFAAFVLPTVAWMAFMGATTGNFALTGASQDSSAFYAASDPRIQVWRGDMYNAVRESAKKHYQTDQVTPKQLNAEFWAITRSNYEQHWQYHAARLWHNAYELARFTPRRSAVSTAESERQRLLVKCLLVSALILAALWRRQWVAAAIVAGLGLTWAFWPPGHPWLVLLTACVGIGALFFGRRDAFLLAAYWGVGVGALYLTGGTWGPPLGGVYDLNALGYRLGFQFFFAADVMVVGLLGFVVSRFAPPAAEHPLLRASPAANRLAGYCVRAFLVSLVALVGTGSVIVVSRLVARAQKAPVAYPELASLASIDFVRGSKALTEITPLRVAVNAHSSAPLLIPAMSSGFIWNLPGQERSMLLLYQQVNVQPVSMSPRHVYVEIPRHVPDHVWRNRQGAWLLRSFPNTAQNSNLPYYFEMPAVQAFVPLAADGRSYAVEQTVRFPLAKSATQLVASRELVITGAAPEWSMNSGTRQFPRRFAVRAGPAGQPIDLRFDFSGARGLPLLRFSVELEAAAGSTRNGPVRLRLADDREAGSEGLWTIELDPATTTEVAVSQDSPAQAVLRLTCDNLLPTDTLWIYELVMTADDFTQ